MSMYQHQVMAQTAITHLITHTQTQNQKVDPCYAASRSPAGYLGSVG